MDSRCLITSRKQIFLHNFCNNVAIFLFMFQNILASYGNWWHGKCLKSSIIWTLTPNELWATYLFMKHTDKYCLVANWSIFITVLYVIIFHREKSKFLENIVDICKGILKLWMKIWVPLEVRYWCWMFDWISRLYLVFSIQNAFVFVLPSHKIFPLIWKHTVSIKAVHFKMFTFIEIQIPNHKVFYWINNLYIKHTYYVHFITGSGL